jgi:hypothetical protein
MDMYKEMKEKKKERKKKRKACVCAYKKVNGEYKERNLIGGLHFAFLIFDI